MPKFGWCRFAEDKFGDRARYHNSKFKMKGAVHIGPNVRRTVGKGPKCTKGTVTYRVRAGNGAAGSVAGFIYQDKYPYTEAMAAVDNTPQASKDKFAAGVAAWQMLSDSQKAEWNRKATFGYRMSGYNLFLHYYMLGN